MHLLVMRFSAIGDVVLTVPVLTAVRQQFPEAEITMVSRGMFRPLYEPLNINFIAADFKRKHKGLLGLRRLYQDIISQAKPDVVIDLHSVLRSHVVGSFFRLSGVPVFKIDKGRRGKQQLTRRHNKVRKQLRHTLLRYADVFEQAGLKLKLSPADYPAPTYESAEADELWQQLNMKGQAIGMAPLSTYPGKTWPIAKVAKLLDQLSADGTNILLFGGPADKATLDKLADPQRGIHNIAGRLNFAGEITLMQKLSMMISMDSSNMHMATLAKIPVVSIWGATHRFTGFGPLGHNEDLIVEVPTEKLTCRPCSVFGNRPCFRHDYACLNWLETEDVLEKIRLVNDES